MKTRTGICQDCGTQTVGGERGVVPSRCPACLKEHRRRYHQAWGAARPPRQPKIHEVTCSDCSAVSSWTGRGSPPTRCASCTKVRRLRANRERGRLRRAAKKVGQPHRIGVCAECFAEFVGPPRGSVPSKCPPCTEEWNRVRYKQTPNRSESSRRLHLMTKYGMTPEDWERLFESQSGRCAICQLHEDAVGGRLHVDHCHATGSVRGLLCQGCNTGIGKLREDPEIIRAAAAYVEHHKAATP